MQTMIVYDEKLRDRNRTLQEHNKIVIEKIPLISIILINKNKQCCSFVESKRDITYGNCLITGRQSD